MIGVPARLSRKKAGKRASIGLADSAVVEAVLLALRAAPEGVLALGLRDLRRRRPDLFERLSDIGAATIVIAPTDLPVAFRLSPMAERRPVEVVGRRDARPSAARISGPLALLLEVLDGSSDADAAFFSRRLVVTGDTQTVVGLHNTLEAAELAPSDLLGAPPRLRGLTDAWARRGLKWMNRSEARV